MNRRMPNGMYGGVRGGLNSPYSIVGGAAVIRYEMAAYNNGGKKVE